MRYNFFKRKWTGMAIIALLGFSTMFFSLGCSVFGIRTGYEEAGYAPVEKKGAFEIRDYEELVVAETFVKANYKEAGNQGFRRLFRYISGDNAAKSKIEMTAPVIADERGGEKISMTTPVIGEETNADGWRYMFVLPSSYTLETAPEPTNPEVKLSVIPPHKVAVIRYAGTWKESTMRAKTEALQEWIKASDYEAVSEPRAAGYDPPWTLPPLRRNEVMIDVR
ncbi:MAG: hypothetical protein ACI9TH_003910 [Kiritimatiellia bacterium]|jgi:hypothetical protein